MDINANYTESNSSSNDSAKISFLRDALYTHAKQVSDFCQSGFSRVDSYSADKRPEQYQDFSTRAVKLIDQLSHLIKCARNANSLSNTLNLEQLEAKADSLYRQVESYEFQTRKSA